MRSGFIFGDDEELDDGLHMSIVDGELKSFWKLGNMFTTSNKNEKDPGLHTKFIDGEMVTYYEDGLGNIHKL